MDFAFSEEQVMLRESVERFVRDEYSFEQRREYKKSDSGFSEKNWSLFAELGWLSVPFSEDDGGFGGTALDVMIMMEEFGKGLVLEPYLATVVMGGGLVRLGAPDAVRKAVAEQVIAGEMHLAFAYAEPQGRYNLANLVTTATPDDGGWRINGFKATVLNGGSANKVIVSTRSGGDQCDIDGITLFLVDTDAPGVSRTAYATQDGNSAAEITFDNVSVGPDAVIGTVGGGYPLIETIIDEAIIAVGAEAVGAMECLYKATVQYANTREQFGVPIGKFQVLQHRMVEMFMECEQTKSALYRAAMMAATGSDDTSRAVSALKVQVGKAGRFVGQQAIQIHGGMGMTYELNVGHYFKRLTMIGTLFGNSDFHLRRFAALDQRSTD